MGLFDYFIGSSRRVVAIAVLLAMTTACSFQKRSSDEARQLVTAAHKSKDYSRLMALADSLERAGDLLPSTANYWRGYACDRMKQKEEAETYWRTALQQAAASDDDEDTDNYVKAASHLANLLCLNGDFEGTLKMAMPVVERLEKMGRDNTSDYNNLLIYIGLSQINTGLSEEDAHIGFLRACAKHRENIERNHNDQAYKDAIAGLVNIAYYCVGAKNYDAALYYTRSFGDLLIEYEQMPDADAAYVDRQAGRYTIYKAWALDRMGKKEEAEKTYEAFLDTKFSGSAEGKKLADNYLKGLLEVMELKGE